MEKGRFSTLSAALCALVLLLSVSHAHAETILVNVLTDNGPNAGPAGDCELRDAIDAANTDSSTDGCRAGDGADSIILPAGVITLDPTNGSLSVQSSIELVGAGIGVSIVDGANGTGIVTVNPLSSLSASRMRFQNGSATGDGGAIWVTSGAASLTLSHTHFLNNESTARGGAVSAIESVVQVNESTFEGNSAGTFGGAIQGNDVHLDVETTRFIQNTAGDEGGALSFVTGSTVDIRRSLFDTNAATGPFGGAISFLADQMTVTNSTFWGNAAAQSGGAVHTISSVSFNHCTFANNAASMGTGGAIDANALASVELVGSLFENNGAPMGPNCSIPMAAMAFDANNVLDDLTGCNLQGMGNVTTPGGTVGMLGFNGGPTETVVPDPANPAIGNTQCGRAGSSSMNVGLDQRGLIREGTNCTAGAFEVDVVEVLAEVNPGGPPACLTGGSVLTIGPDLNGNGTLELDEVTTTSTICNQGQVRIEVAPEQPGANCAAGGQMIEVGIDTDANGMLNGGEAASTSYVCNGQDGVDAVQPLVVASPESPGANCTVGGQRIEIGLDQNANGTLEMAEVASTSFVCDGEDGPESLVQITPEPQGANCAEGGQMIETGVDADGDGSLSPMEVDSTSFACDGEDGEDEGCGCTAASAPSNGAFPLLLLLGGLVLLRVRRRGLGRLLRRSAPLIALFITFAASTAHAEVIVVDVLTDGTGGSGDCELRDAIAASNTNSSVDGCTSGLAEDTILLPEGTIVLTSPLVVNTSLELIGAGIGKSIIDGNDATRLIELTGDGDLYARGITFQNGASSGLSGGGAILAGQVSLGTNDGARLVLERTDFFSNSATADGGAIEAIDADVRIRESSFRDNEGGTNIGRGGAIASSNGSLLIETTVFSDNVAEGAGALEMFETSADIRRSLFQTNSARTFNGGAIEAFDSGLTVTNSTFSGNAAQTSGGAIQTSSGNTTLVNHSTFVNNTATTFDGGAIEALGSFRLVGSVLERNTAGGSGPNCAASAATVDFDENNVLDDLSGCNLSGTNNVTTAMPTLGMLAWNGGSTQTIAPNPDSPAIGLTDCGRASSDLANVGVDQRGLTRAGTSCTAGAFEVEVLEVLSDVSNASTACPEEGYLLEIGPDIDSDGVLSPAEVTSSNTICTPGSGVIEVTTEPMGANCAAGGQRIELGVDANGNLALDPGEATTTTFACNGEDGVDAVQPLVTVTPEPPGANCLAGGQMFEVGLDTDSSGTLDPMEVDETSFACDGVDGSASLARTTPEPPGANCSEGGQMLETGVDSDGNGTLDPNEVLNTTFLCDGVDGADEDGCGCSAAASPTNGLFPLLLLFGGLVMLRIRRRNLPRFARLFAPTVALTFALTFLLAAPSAHAETIVVDVLTDGSGTAMQCELRDAVISANLDIGTDGCKPGSGSDTIVVPPGQIALNAATGPLLVSTDIELIGAGAGVSLLDGQNATQLIEVISGASLFATRMTFQNGSAGGGANGGAFALGRPAAQGGPDGARLTLDRVEFTGNVATGRGGAINALDSDIRITNSDFTSNIAGIGGAVSVFDSSLVVETTRFFGNSAGTVGALIIDGDSSTVDIRRSTFDSNAASTAFGGAIGIDNGRVYVENSTFSRNSAVTDGGAVVTASLTEARFNHVTFFSNDATGNGGGISANGEIDLIGSLFDQNIAGGTGPDCFASAAQVTFAQNNVLSDLTGCAVGTTNNGITPAGGVLAPVDWNGGPTRTAMPLPLPANPAIGFTDCGRSFGTAWNLGVDQRGLQRPGANCTAGAVEVDVVDILVAVSPAGANCPQTGSTLEIGPDLNGDGTLQPDEVTTTNVICAQAKTLVDVTTEPPGANCAAGGERIDVGIDANEDGVLDPGEVSTTGFVCDGEDGSEAAQPRVATTQEPAGANCAAGGEQIEIGLDADGNGSLDPAEVDSTQYACNGEDGLVPLVVTTTEPPGVNCADGGEMIEAGFDVDGNGTLDPAEIDDTAFVCDGVDMDDGCGCSAASSPSKAAFPLILLVGALFVLRRRRD